VTVVVFLVALEHARTTAFAARGTSLGLSHGSGGCGLVDEHEAVRFEIRLALEPDLVGRLHIRAILLGGMAGALALEEARQAARCDVETMLGQSGLQFMQEDARPSLIERQDLVGMFSDPM